jgi:hypothetical protein
MNDVLNYGEGRECPEKNLWAAVLLRAFKDLEDAKLKRGVISWLNRNDKSAGAFRWICNVLDLDAAWIKEELKSGKWRGVNHENSNPK